MLNHNPVLRSLGLMACGLILPLSVALAANFPSGTYTAHENITVTFDGKGQFHVSDGKATEVSGSYTVKGNKLEMTDKEGAWACTKKGEQSGTYTWKYADSALTLTKVADHCEARVGTLATAPWKHSA
jgi:hypothetical protein